jgi:hypothetical protein
LSDHLTKCSRTRTCKDEQVARETERYRKEVEYFQKLAQDLDRQLQREKERRRQEQRKRVKQQIRESPARVKGRILAGRDTVADLYNNTLGRIEIQSPVKLRSRTSESSPDASDSSDSSDSSDASGASDSSGSSLENSSGSSLSSSTDSLANRPV